jgi:hypothetical protein
VDVCGQRPVRQPCGRGRKASAARHGPRNASARCAVQERHRFLPRAVRITAWLCPGRASFRRNPAGVSARRPAHAAIPKSAGIPFAPPGSRPGAHQDSARNPYATSLFTRHRAHMTIEPSQALLATLFSNIVLHRICVIFISCPNMLTSYIGMMY